MALAALAFLAVLLGLQAPAQAHAVLVKTTPIANSTIQEPPTEVVLTFSESITPVKDKIRVIGPDGNRADNGKPTTEGAVLRISLLSDNLPRGTYLVSFRVISADSHPVPGGFTFSYGEPSVTPPTESPEDQQQPENTAVGNAIKVVKYLGYLGMILLVGAAWVLALLWPARLDRKGPRRLLWTGFGLVTLATLAGIYVQAPYTSGSGLFAVDGDDLAEVMRSQFGVAHLVRLAVLAVGAILVRPLLKGTATTTDNALALLVGGIAVLTWPLSGHPAASPVPPVSVVADAFHLGAAAFWLGGLSMLAIFLLRQVDEREAGAILPVWSRWAGLAVSVVLLAGVISALIEVGTPTALVGTPYGRWVIVKIGLVALLVGTAAFARRLVPRLETGKLRRLVTTELAIAALVLGVTATLTQTTPARTAEAIAQAPQQTPTFTATKTTSLFRLQVEVDAAKVGDNLVHLWAYAPDGQPLKVVEWKVTAALPSAGVEPVDVPTLKLTDNHVTGSILLPNAGDWQFKFTLRTTEIDQDSVTITVPVK